MTDFAENDTTSLASGDTFWDYEQLRQPMHRKRLQEAHKLHMVYTLIGWDGIDFASQASMSDLLVTLHPRLKRAFQTRYCGPHTCFVPNCSDTVVTDGHMKSCRMVCMAMSSVLVDFFGIGSIVVGCPHTPAKGSRWCKDHKHWVSFLLLIICLMSTS